MGWLKTAPIVSLLLAVAFLAAPYAIDPARSWGDRYDRAIDEARELLLRNPRLVVDADGERLLDPEWMSELRAHAEETQAGLEVELPARMVARSQAQLDTLLGQAHDARRQAEPAWRLGVLDGATPTRNYWAHAFVHDGWAGIGLLLVVLLVVASPLERSWGSPLFAAFVLLAVPVSAQGFRLLDASGGVPWHGSSGLAAGIVGAYFIRGLGGHFVVPGLVVLPVWLGLEAFLVRGFWLDDLGVVPWATLCGSIAFGAGSAALLRLLGVETRLDAVAARRASNGPNPVVVRAARLRSDGDPNQAFDLIAAAWREDRGNEEIAECFFSIASELGRPEAAAESILPVLRQALKKGQIERALGYWLPLATRRCEVRLEPTAAVRLGEALLDAGHPDEALFSLRSALDAGASTAHAVRILNIARDLDPGLTRRAASIALADPGLDAPTRARLEPLAAAADGDSEAIRPAPARAQAQASALAAPAGDPLGEVEPSGDESVAAASPDLSSAAPDDVLSHWNDRGALSAGALEGAASPEEASGATSASVDLLETRASLFGDDDLDFLDADLETDDEMLDSDRTPVLEESDETTSPIRPGIADPACEATVTVTARSGASEEIPVDHTPDPGRALLRGLRVIEAVPVELRGDGLEIDTDGRGKSRLPFARIEAISVAAVRGLGPRPVLVVDCGLNWRDDIGSPLKLIRLRSDRFEPGAVGLPEASESPIAALGAFAADLQRRSGAVCRPSEAFLAGQFASFDSLEAYEREALGAARELGS